MSNVFRVDSNLMCTPSSELEFQKRRTRPQPLDNLERCQRTLASSALGLDRHPCTIGRIPGNESIQRALVFRVAPHQRQIPAPRSEQVPTEKHRRATVREENCSARCAWVLLSLATTIKPVVSLSIRCTIPGRNAPPVGSDSPKAASPSTSPSSSGSSTSAFPCTAANAASSRCIAFAPTWCSKPFTRVSRNKPGAGWTTMPARLFTTTRCSSS
mmetsp:Transcript_25352/g.59809  ORF Transcript_25352/g.59809 Transcript_25352/m.59809 type:complete len:214 (-) Transcript_25352:271-912(-)